MQSKIKELGELEKEYKNKIASALGRNEKGIFGQLGVAEKQGKNYTYIIFRQRVERFKKEYLQLHNEVMK